ncbi:MAG: FeoA family protein [Oscillospiraceae bacterium]
MTLDELKIGSSAVITAVGGDGALRCRLLDMGLTPRTRVTLQKVAPMGDPIEIRVRGYELTLRVEEAKKIEIEGCRHDLCTCRQPKLRQDDALQRPHRFQPARGQLPRCDR